MPKPVTIVRDQRPTRPELSTYSLGRNQWVKAVIFPDDVGVWKLYNTSVLQLIRYAYHKNDLAFNELNIRDMIAYRTNPRELWLQRANAASVPVVQLEIWRW